MTGLNCFTLFKKVKRSLISLDRSCNQLHCLLASTDLRLLSGPQSIDLTLPRYASLLPPTRTESISAIEACSCGRSHRSIRSYASALIAGWNHWSHGNGECCLRPFKRNFDIPNSTKLIFIGSGILPVWTIEDQVLSSWERSKGRSIRQNGS